MSVWVARAGRYGEQESYALENGVALVAWDDLPDLREVAEREKLLPLIRECYPDEGEGTLKNWESQLWAFSKRIEVGDLIALPRKSTSTVAFGRVTGPYRYIADAPVGCHHQVPVEWVKTDISRQKIDGDLRFSLGGAMTVFQISRNNAEERLRALVDGKPAPQPRFYDTSADAGEAETTTSDSPPDLQQYALDQITEHISRKFRGNDLERLVEAILNANGFVTERANPGRDGGVDIVGGRGVLGLESPRLCVQVKSQDDPIDVGPFRELQGVLATFGADLGLIVAWGGFKQSVLSEARRSFFQIRLWDSDALVRNVQEVYDHLPEDIQKDLPLKRIWALVTD